MLSPIEIVVAPSRRVAPGMTSFRARREARGPTRDKSAGRDDRQPDSMLHTMSSVMEGYRSTGALRLERLQSG
jgi:hypothetical protein